MPHISVEEIREFSEELLELSESQIQIVNEKKLDMLIPFMVAWNYESKTVYVTIVGDIKNDAHVKAAIITLTKEIGDTDKIDALAVISEAWAASGSSDKDGDWEKKTDAEKRAWMDDNKKSVIVINIETRQPHCKNYLVHYPLVVSDISGKRKIIRKRSDEVVHTENSGNMQGRLVNLLPPLKEVIREEIEKKMQLLRDGVRQAKEAGKETFKVPGYDKVFTVSEANALLMISKLVHKIDDLANRKDK